MFAYWRGYEEKFDTKSVITRYQSLYKDVKYNLSKLWWVYVHYKEVKVFVEGAD